MAEHEDLHNEFRLLRQPSEYFFRSIELCVHDDRWNAGKVFPSYCMPSHNRQLVLKSCSRPDSSHAPRKTHQPVGNMDEIIPCAADRPYFFRQLSLE